MLNIKDPKKHFPIFKNSAKNGKEFVYLDSASTTQKPESVIKAITEYYENYNANIHRGIYDISEIATEKYEACRRKVAEFINAKSSKEIIFTRNTTESINLIAYTWGNLHIKEGDEIIVSALEHHSNLIPWQQLCQRKNATLKVIPLTKDLTLNLTAYEKLLSKKTKLVAITAISNVTGTINDIETIIEKAHAVGAHVLIDNAQGISHKPTDVQKLNCDFMAFSSHKMFGPTGIGVLYAKEEILDNLPPFLFGGDMVGQVSQFEATWNEIPHKFEAGTPNIADTIAFQKAIEFIEEIGFEAIEKHDHLLTKKAKEMLAEFPQIKVYSPKSINESSPAISFTIDGIHPHDIATIFNEENIAIRSGHHCCMPLMETLQIPATARMSFSIYNTTEEIQRAKIAIERTLKTFS